MIAVTNAAGPRHKKMARTPNQSILEGIITTLSAPPETPPQSTPGSALEAPPMAQRVNISPMGPIVDESMSELLLRPFNTSTTYKNLKATGQGVFHVTDDVLLLARAAVGQVAVDGDVPVRPAERVEGLILTGACRYYELQVVEVDDRDARTTIRARVVAEGRLRDFFGFNRARHAVVEAAILATRVHLTGPQPVLSEYEKLQTIIDKTGDQRHHQAMSYLWQYVKESAANPQATVEKP